jgi:uncharacterized repeat protein (TIGR01451 family)
MMHTRPTLRSWRTALRAWWIALVLLGLFGLARYAAQPAAAAPAFQTVPPRPTATPTEAPVATSTPQRDDNDDDDDDDRPSEAPTSTPAAQPAAPAELTGVVTAERLNVRAGPGTTFAVLGQVLQGETVQILERNADGSWWRACCASGTETEGWLSAQFIRPNFDAAQANTLIPVAGAPVAQPTAVPAEPTPTPTTALTTSVTSPVTSPVTITTTTAITTPMVTTPTLELGLVISQTPAVVWQGQTVALLYTIRNPGPETAVNVELRNEFPGELSYQTATVSAEGMFEQQSGDQNRVAFSAIWPELAAGASITATVQVQIAPDLADGTVVDNLAAVVADNALATTAGITIGMPPTLLPDFQ